MTTNKRSRSSHSVFTLTTLCICSTFTLTLNSARAANISGSAECAYATGLPFLLFGVIQDRSPIWTCSAVASYKAFSVFAMNAVEAEQPDSPYESGRFDDVVLTGSIPFGRDRAQPSSVLSVSIERFHLRKIVDGERQYPRYLAWAPQAFLMVGTYGANNIGFGVQAFLPVDFDGVGREYMIWTEGNLKTPRVLEMFQLGLRTGLVASDVFDGVDYFPRGTGYADASLELQLTRHCVIVGHAMGFADRRHGTTTTEGIIYSGGVRLQF